MLQAVEAAQRASGSGLTQLQSAFSGTSRQLYLADPAAMRSVGADQWSFAPSDSRSALAVRIEPTNGGDPPSCLCFQCIACILMCEFACKPCVCMVAFQPFVHCHVVAVSQACSERGPSTGGSLGNLSCLCPPQMSQGCCFCFVISSEACPRGSDPGLRPLPANLAAPACDFIMHLIHW